MVLKTLRPDRHADGRCARALLREGRLPVRLTHPHVVRGYAALREPAPAIVLEALRGETVSHVVERRRRWLAARELAFLGLHVCSAIGYLHGQGILHLDVKPSNVIAEGAGRSSSISASLPARALPAGRGTWCYMAPEQARDGVVGPPADVWGIGGLLFEAATGACAFGDDDGEHPQLAGRAVPIGRLRCGLPRALAAAIDACLEPEPAARPSVARLAGACELAAGLQDAGAAQPESALTDVSSTAHGARRCSAAMSSTPYGDVLLRLAIDVVAVAILAYALYYRRHRRGDLPVIYALFNVGLFLALVVIASGKVSVGVGFGLFAVLSIIRLRSEPFTHAELAYFFVALVLALVNGIDLGSVLFAMLLDSVALAAAAVIDHPRLRRPSRQLEVTLELVFADHDALRRHLEERLNAHVTEARVLEVDYVRDTTRVAVRCLDRPPTAPLPREAIDARFAANGR